MEPKDIYRSALQKALRDFRDKDPVLMGENSGAKYNGQEFLLKFLNEEYLVGHPEGDVRSIEKHEPPLEIGILLLHYLTGCKSIPLSTKLISFRELPSGFSYEKAFYREAVEPLLREFSESPSRFEEAAKGLGGEKVDLGDMAYSICVLPRIPLVFVLWRGDEEIPGSANILFDISSSSHLPTEDLGVLGEITTRRLIDLAK